MQRGTLVWFALLSFTLVMEGMEEELPFTKKVVTKTVTGKSYMGHKNADKRSTEALFVATAYYEGYTNLAITSYGIFHNSPPVFVKKDVLHEKESVGNFFPSNDELLKKREENYLSFAHCIKYQESDKDDFMEQFVFAGEQVNIFDETAFDTLSQEKFIMVDEGVPVLAAGLPVEMPRYQYHRCILTNTVEEKDGIALLRRLKRDFMYLVARGTLLYSPNFQSNKVTFQLHHPWLKKLVFQEGRREVTFIGKLRDLVDNQEIKNALEKGLYTFCNGQDIQMKNSAKKSERNEEVIVLTSNHTEKTCSLVTQWRLTQKKSEATSTINDDWVLL